MTSFQHPPQEEAGGVEHAVQGSKTVGPLTPLLYPEEHVFAQALHLRQLLPKLLGGSSVAVLIHPLRHLAELSGDLLLVLF